MLALGLSIPVFSADGLVVTKEATLFEGATKDKKANEVICKLKIGDALLPGRHNSDSRYTIQTTCFSFHWCATGIN